MKLEDLREMTSGFGDASFLFVSIDGKRVEIKSIEVEPSSLVGAQIITLKGK